MLLNLKEITMTQPIATAIPAEVRERVIAAAVELYEQADRQRFPTVDAVRRLSRADMNTVSGVMKEWRQAQTTQAAPVVVAVPEAIKQANDVAVADLWKQATALANQSLSIAQASWEEERKTDKALRDEMGEGYEAQAAEFESTKKQLADSEAKTVEQAQQLATVRQSEAEAINRADLAEARISDLRGELDRAIQEIDRQRAELVDARAKTEAANAAIEAVRAELATVKTQGAEREKQAAAEAQRTADRLAKIETDRDQVRAELVKVQAKAEAADQSLQEHRKTAATEALRTAERLTQAEAARDAARKEASTAREEAAKTAGKLEAMQTQAASLIDALAARQDPAPEAAAKNIESQTTQAKGKAGAK
jgi:colicin import membrane protein